jgi:integrase
MAKTIDLLGLVKRANSLRPNTKRAYSNAVRQWIDFAGDSPAAWTVENAQAFYDKLLADGIAVATANNMITGGLSYVFGRAAALYPGVVADITVAVDRAKDLDEDARSRPLALHAPQAQALLTACDGPRLIDMRDRAMAVIGLYTGMRVMSLVDIHTDRVHQHHNFVLISVVQKGGKPYRVPLDNRAWALTENYRKSLQRTRGNAGPLFPGLRSQLIPGGITEVVGEGLTDNGAYKALARRADKAHLSHFHPHLFRHTFATWCRSAKIEDYLIEVVTGHKSNRGLVHRVYTDETQLHDEVTTRCYEAMSARLTELKP